MDEHDTAQADDTALAESGDASAPITHEVEVAVSRTRAWDAYVHGLEEWWHPGWTAFGTGLDRIEVEPHAGGRIIEHGRDGEQREWGEVLEAEPGERFAHTLHPSHEGDPTVVTVDFDDLPHGGTRVRLTHGGWNESNLAGRAKHTDWPMLLERYRAHAQHV
ncbi:Uncharacterized conserved protein YndB, AHSA1/START domain [Agrococcus baldri]|uniref:Uncharacterized conserved protein YndB, AHSA1/START domain n=2 Tax=Agrococcus baldri TaxID=153730 RepID=A0AA94HLD0_9MICO|nr:Uncharacterized conserved protein YndB, AHSA1/START domain [Agrococcus baldri]